MFKKLFKSDKKEAAASTAAPEAEPVEITQQRSAPGQEVKAAATAAAVAAAGEIIATNGVSASSEWLTTLILKMWPYVSDAVEKQVKDTLPGILDANRPKWMEGIFIDKFELGKDPPKITFINVDQNNDDVVDDIRLEIGLDWSSKADIEMTVKPVPADIKFVPGIFESVIKGMATVHAGVEKLGVKATAVITLVPMVPVIPVLKSVQICLREQPILDFSITFGALQVGFLNLLKPFILKTLKTAVFASMVYPEHITVKLDPSVPDYFKPEGLLLVTVLEAKNLPKSDWFSRGDPFVSLGVREKWKKRTTTKQGDNPSWGETFEFMVHSRRFQRLSLELLDEDSAAAADTIGVASCSLSDLQPGQETTVWLDVYEDDAAEKPLKGCQLQVAVKYLTSGLPEIQALKKAPTDPLPPGGATMIHGGILKVSFRSITVPNKEAAPLVAEVKAAGEVRYSGNINVNAATPDVLTIPTIQVFDFDILAKDADTTIEVALMKAKGKDPVAAFGFSLADVKDKNPQVGITGGLFEFSSGGYGLATDAYYHDI